MRRFISSWFSSRVLTLLITHNFYRKAEREREREREREKDTEGVELMWVFATISEYLLL